MAKNNQEAIAKAWAGRIVQADKAYEAWDKKYRCRELEDFYLGHQYEAGVMGEDGKDPYVVNLAFATVEIKIPSLLFYRPKIDIDVREPFDAQPGSRIDDRTKLLEDTANTFVADRRVGFQDQALLALREAFYRFGVVEVGYSGDFIDNPNAGKPMLHDDGSEMQDESGKTIVEPDRKLRGKDSETVYVRRIPAHQFRVSVGSNNRLDWSDWCGYYEWEYVEDVKSNPAYKNTSALKAQGSWKTKAPSDTTQRASDVDSEDERRARSKMLKLWKIWDIRTKTRWVFAEGSPKPLQQEPYTYLPFAALKFHDILDQFYPLPPMYNWVGPQKELNTTRQALRMHMARFKRRYGYVDGSIDESELEKLETGPDGTYVRFNTPEALQAIEDAPLDSAFWRNIPATKDDFLQVTGVGGDARGAVEASTATQAAIIDTRSRVRESFSRYQVSLWLADIVRLLLWTIRDRMLLPFVIKRNVDMQAPDAFARAAEVASLWREIKAEDLGEVDYEVSVDVESLSPMNEDTERQQWMAWMSSLTPQRVVTMVCSDVLLRKDLAFFGIRGDKQFQEVKKALEAQLLIMSGMAPVQAVGQLKQGQMPMTPGGDMPGMPGKIPPVQQGMGAPNGTAGPVGPPIEGRVNQQLRMQTNQLVPGASVQEPFAN